MSVLRLLTTSKSLVGLKDSEVHYRLTGQRLLPKFGPAKNPFCGMEKPEPARPAARKAAEVTSGSPQARAVIAASLVRPTPLVHSNRSHWAGALLSRATEFLTKSAGKLGGLLSRSGRKPARLAMSPVPKPPLQGELSLDRIKVVRNDLSDADLEVVPAKRPVLRPQAAASPVLPRAERFEAGGTAWVRLAGYFRAGKTGSGEV